jgi:hypothetical protein
MLRSTTLFLFFAISTASRAQLNYRLSYKDSTSAVMEEFPMLISKACGIDLGGIYKKWQLPVE